MWSVVLPMSVAIAVTAWNRWTYEASSVLLLLTSPPRTLRTVEDGTRRSVHSRHAVPRYEFGRKRRKADMQLVAASNCRGANDPEGDISLGTILVRRLSDGVSASD